MNNKNVCPYCGGKEFFISWIYDNTFAAYCENDDCLAAGPLADTKEEAIQAFCNPKYLLTKEKE